MQKLRCCCLVSLLVCSLILVSLTCFFSPAHASTVVHGLIAQDTTWTAADSPYVLKSPVLVGEGVTLTVESGALVDFNSSYLQVEGTLIAKGTPTKPVTFQNGYISFEPSTVSYNETDGTGTVLQYVNALQVNGRDCSPKIVNSEIGGLRLERSESIVTGNKIQGLTAEGNETISNNIIGSTNVYGTPLLSHNIINGSLESGAGAPVIYSNEILGVLYVSDGSPTIWNNTITYAPDGSDESIVNIFSQGQTVFCNNRLIGLFTPEREVTYTESSWWGPSYTNTVTIGPYNFSNGIAVGGNTLISNCIISGVSTSSISVSYDGRVTIENCTLNKGIIVGEQFYGLNINYSNIEGGITLSNNAAANVTAQNNWWGTTNPAVIDDLITDFNDNIELGKVSYLPFLSAPNKQTAPDINAPLPTPTPSTTPMPTDGGGFNFSISLDWEQITIVVLVVLVAVLFVFIGVLLRRTRK